MKRILLLITLFACGLSYGQDVVTRIYINGTPYDVIQPSTTGLFSTTTTSSGLTPGSNNAGATYYLDGSGNWSIPGGGGNITIQDEGTPLTTAVTLINFVGAGVTVTEPIADQMTVTITGDGTGTDDQTAAEVTYSNATSGLTATDVQAALDEVEARVDANDAKVTNTDNQTAAEVSVAASPSNYTAGTADVEAHLSGIDTAIGNKPDIITAATGTGTVLNLSGYYQYNMGSAGTGTTYTTSGAVDGGYVEALVNATSEPTVTGATKLPNTQSFVVSTNMILHVKAFGSTIKYWFTEF